ncbi:MAG TPA: MoaD/ThiS family protein [Methanospirillum sp.]|nr:MoaD/ThiS family protein [Methanospirillum sp.]
MIIQFPDNREENVEAGGKTIETILIDLGVNPVEMLISRDDEIIPEDTIPAETDTIRLIRIAHGG